MMQEERGERERESGKLEQLLGSVSVAPICCPGGGEVVNVTEDFEDTAACRYYEALNFFIGALVYEKIAFAKNMRKRKNDENWFV